jgi:hypothetical protein
MEQIEIYDITIPYERDLSVFYNGKVRDLILQRYKQI